MSGAHEPREEFVSQLERQVRVELRRRDLAEGAPGWMPQSRLAIAGAMAGIVVVSMALGGGVVAAAYQARLDGQRDLLLDTFEQRAALAMQRRELAAQHLRDVERRVSIGIEPQESARDLQLTVTEADAELKSIRLDIEEIRATGREPMHALSAPLVAGRDFVMERLRVEMSVPVAALDLEKTRAQAARKRFDVGLADAMEVEAAGTRLIELESAVEAFQRKIGIRQTVVKGGVPPAVADLRGLEAETELRRAALARRVDFARKQVQELKSRIDVGTADPLKLAEAELRLQELQLEMTKADYDLLLIRKQLGK